MAKQMHLYHGSRHSQPLYELQPSKPAQTKNGVTAEYVFATHRLDQAVLYTAPFPVDGSFLTTLSADPGDALALFVNGSGRDYFAKPVNGLVYRVPADTFTHVAGSREWVSPHAVALPESPVLRVTSHDQIMRQGVQIFTLSDKADGNTIRTLASSATDREKLAEVLKSGTVTWENQHQNAAPDSRLQNLMQVARCAALRVARSRRKCTFD